MLFIFNPHHGEEHSNEISASGVAKSAAHEAAREAARVAVGAIAERMGMKTPENGESYKGGSCPTGRKVPKDWAYMEASGKVLRDLPDTWKAYKQDDAGRMDIIKMEYGELLKAKTDEEISHELIHLGSACLHYWRLINNAE